MEALCIWQQCSTEHKAKKVEDPRPQQEQKSGWPKASAGPGGQPTHGLAGSSCIGSEEAFETPLNWFWEESNSEDCVGVLSKLDIHKALNLVNVNRVDFLTESLFSKTEPSGLS